jgi:hypothetical protein
MESIYKVVLFFNKHHEDAQGSGSVAPHLNLSSQLHALAILHSLSSKRKIKTPHATHW